MLVIGLDCLDPGLVERFLDDLPTLRGLIEAGEFRRLRSVDPPITVPAWMCAFTGRDPGELGIYGFRNRADRSYDGLRIATSAAFRAPALWDELGGMGLRSIVVGVPGTYPPRPIRGLLVSGFLAPGIDRDYTFPRSLKHRIAEIVGEYIIDVRDFRTEDKDHVIEEVHRMTGRRFALMGALLSGERWDLAVMVEMGPDRIHHALWAHHDRTHPKHDPDSPYKDAIRDYYRFLDGWVGRLLEALPVDTQVIVMSDHGIQPMYGGIAVNEWLIREGYLALREYPREPVRMDDLIARGLVDWSRTVAWGEGGYYGRIFLNVRGREPAGVVPPGDYEAVRRELAAKLASLPDERGNPLGTRVLFPEDIYREVNGIPPDLLVYFGGLRWRSIGTVGRGMIHWHENDTGPDDANHAPDGVFIASPALAGRDLSLLDIHDLILGLFR
ncbi:MAG: phosphodiesterase [Caldiserica bacterium]|nr:phosphodiesterase [Caldisericota bacterium]